MKTIKNIVIRYLDDHIDEITEEYENELLQDWIKNIERKHYGIMTDAVIDFLNNNNFRAGNMTPVIQDSVRECIDRLAEGYASDR